jgi:hypothetical protein
MKKVRELSFLRESEKEKTSGKVEAEETFVSNRISAEE